MWPSAWNKLYKKSIIKRFNIRFKEKILYEDHTFFYEYFSHCNTFSYIDEPLYYYRQQRPNSITTHSVGRENEIFKILEYIYDIFQNIYSGEQLEKLYIKIVIRLLYERRFVFSENDKNYYLYLRNVGEYLGKWDKEVLLINKDCFIEETDPIFCSSEELKEIENKKRGCGGKEKIKNNIKKIPFIKEYFSLKEEIRKCRDEVWYGFDQMKSTQNKVIDINPENNFESKTIGKIERKLSSIENKETVSKNKIDEIWWLSWNIKNNISNEKTENNSNYLQWYPTWIPCDFPEYFLTSAWEWPDNYKRYYIEHAGKCEQELDELYKGLSKEDIASLKELWERNIHIIPESEYMKKKTYLLKRDDIYTNEEQKAQKEILKTYTEIKNKYILPDEEVYEIPVFYYEHGLKNMFPKYLEWINKGDILDLGGYIGDSALVLSKYTSQKIYTVEMNVKNIEKMKEVFDSNKVGKNITIIQGAVSDKNDIVSCYGDGSHGTLNKMNNTELYQEHSGINVYTVDYLVDEYSMKPRFLKLDVEGNEYKTIKGAEKTIRRYKPILAISIYHTPEDFLHIKPMIESWNLGYSFHFENHNPFDPVYEKMLICMPEINAIK